MADTQVVISGISKTLESLRTGIWRFFGALFMEEKNGVQAVSHQRLLALSTYIACMWIWMGHAHGAEAVPDGMLYTLWGLLGLNGFAKVAGIVKGTDNAPPSA